MKVMLNLLYFVIYIREAAITTMIPFKVADIKPYVKREGMRSRRWYKAVSKTPLGFIESESILDLFLIEST